jgi:hypothetical protein
MNTLEYSTSSLNQIFLIGLISTILVVLIIYLPHYITWRKYNKLSKATGNVKTHGNFVTPFLTPSWIITAVWLGITFFVLLADGKFLESGLASHIVWASIILSVVTVVGSKLTHFKLQKGDISFEGTLKKANNNNDNNKN